MNLKCQLLLGKLPAEAGVVPENEGDTEGEEDEEEFLQDSNPGPLGFDGKDVEDVLNIISQSIYREGEGNTYLLLVLQLVVSRMLISFS